MNIRDLQYIEAVASHRNFSRAASTCNVSQPALSSQIKKLEQELGVTLFERRVNEVELTEFGARAVEAARLILKQTEVIRDIAVEYRDLDALPFKIGMTPTLAPYLTRYFRDMLRDLHPDLRVTLVEDKPLELSKMVERQEIDVALIARNSHQSIYANLDTPPLQFESVWLEPIYLAVREGNPLAQQRSIRAKDVPADQLVRFNVPFGYDLERDLPNVSGKMQEHTGFDVSAARFETVCRHLAYSDNCTIVNSIAAAQFKADNWGLDFIEFEDEGNQRDLGLIFRQSYPRKAILDGIGRYINESPPAGVQPVFRKN